MTRKNPNSIVANRGWVEETKRHRPKTMFYTMLSALWIFPSLGALWILSEGASNWFQASSLPEALVRIKFEEWIAAGLLLLHVLFAGLAIRAGQRETISEKRVLVPNPDVDPRKLY